MRFNVISLMPEMVETALQFGVVGGAFKKGLCELSLINPRDFAEDNHKTVDDRPFGGGDGMLMMAEPLQKSLDSLTPSGPTYFLSPQGRRFDDSMAREWSQDDEITLICGRYGGVDQRFLSHNKITEVSIGDFVLSGGELAAAVIIDSVTRQIPGVLGHAASAVDDSFKGGLLEIPHFTRPQLWNDLGVPPLLLCGDHRKIHEFKQNMGVLVTLQKRPDLLTARSQDWAALIQYVSKLSEDNLVPLGLQKGEILLQLKEREDNG